MPKKRPVKRSVRPAAPITVDAGRPFRLQVTTESDDPLWPAAVVLDPLGDLGGPFPASQTGAGRNRSIWSASVPLGLQGLGAIEVNVQIQIQSGDEDLEHVGHKAVAVITPVESGPSAHAGDHAASAFRCRRIGWSEDDKTRAAALTAQVKHAGGDSGASSDPLLDNKESAHIGELLEDLSSELGALKERWELPAQMMKSIESASVQTWRGSRYASLRVVKRVAMAGRWLQNPCGALKPETPWGGMALEARKGKETGDAEGANAAFISAATLAARFRLSLLARMERQAELVQLVRAGVDNVLVSKDPRRPHHLVISGGTGDAQQRLDAMRKRGVLSRGARMTLIVQGYRNEGNGNANFVGVVVIDPDAGDGSSGPEVVVRQTMYDKDSDKPAIRFDEERKQTAVRASLVQPAFSGPLKILHRAMVSESAIPDEDEASLPPVYAALWRGRPPDDSSSSATAGGRGRASGRGRGSGGARGRGRAGRGAGRGRGRGARGRGGKAGRGRGGDRAVRGGSGGRGKGRGHAGRGGSERSDGGAAPASSGHDGAARRVLLTEVEARTDELALSARDFMSDFSAQKESLASLADPAIDAFLRGPTGGDPVSPRGLTVSQCRAIGAILLRPRLHCIIGPPGTGKSTTLCELLQQILAARRAGRPDARVLFVGHSNAAVDVVVDRLLSGAAGPVPVPGELIRWSSGSHTAEATTQYLGEEGAERVLSVTPGDMAPSGLKQPRDPLADEVERCTILAATVNTASRLVTGASKVPSFSFVVVDEASTVTDGELFALMTGACEAGCKSRAGKERRPRDLMHAAWHAGVVKGSLAARAKGTGVYGHFPLGLGADGPVGEPLLNAKERPCTTMTRTRALDSKDKQARHQLESAAPTLVLCGDPQQLNPVVKSELSTALGMPVSTLERLTGVVKPPIAEMVDQRLQAGTQFWGAATGKGAKAEDGEAAVAEEGEDEEAASGGGAAPRPAAASASSSSAAGGAARADRRPGGTRDDGRFYANPRFKDRHPRDERVYAAAVLSFRGALDNPDTDLRACDTDLKAWADQLAKNALTMDEIEEDWRRAAVLSPVDCPAKTLLSESFRAHPDIHWPWSALSYGGRVRPTRAVDDGSSRAAAAEAAMGAARERLASLGAVQIGAEETPWGSDLRGLLQPCDAEATSGAAAAASASASPAAERPAPWVAHARRLLMEGQTLPLDVAAAARLSWRSRAESGAAGCRVIVVLVQGVMHLDRGETSPTNALESFVARQVLDAAAPHLPGGLSDTGVCTPYWRHAAMMRDQLGDAGAAAGGGAAKVATVNKYQGGEVPFEVISTARAASLLGADPDLLLHGREGEPRWRAAATTGVGFLGNPRRTNVAISRARDCLVIIGDPSILSKDEQWSKVVAYACLAGSLWSLEPAVVMARTGTDVDGTGAAAAATGVASGAGGPDA